MSRVGRFLAAWLVAAAGAGAAAGACALNPQPLPPGLYLADASVRF